MLFPDGITVTVAEAVHVPHSGRELAGHGLQLCGTLSAVAEAVTLTCRGGGFTSGSLGTTVFEEVTCTWTSAPAGRSPCAQVSVPSLMEQPEAVVAAVLMVHTRPEPGACGSVADSEVPRASSIP